MDAATPAHPGKAIGESPQTEPKAKECAAHDKFDWKGFEITFGDLLRGVDDMARAYDVKKLEYEALLRFTGDFWKAWSELEQKLNHPVKGN